MVRLIWTKRALERWAERWADGKTDPAHTISAPNIADVYDGYVKQFKKDTPWALIGDDNVILDTGTTGFTELFV
jgi:hypothetical protein